MNRIYPAVLLISILWSPAFSQETDSVRLYQSYDTLAPTRSFQSDSVISDNDYRYADTLVVKQPDFSHSPSKAIMYSLVLPAIANYMIYKPAMQTGLHNEIFIIKIVVKTR